MLTSVMMVSKVAFSVSEVSWDGLWTCPGSGLSPSDRWDTPGIGHRLKKRANGGICNVWKMKTMDQWWKFEDPDLVLRLELGQGKGQG